MKHTHVPTMQDMQWTDFLLCPDDLKEFLCQFPKGDFLTTMMDFHAKFRESPEDYSFRVARDPNRYPLVLGGWSHRTGVAWFVTTTQAERYPVLTLKAIKECREEALKVCPQLVNEMMRTNKLHVRLLEHIGAEFVGPVYTIGSEPFQAFIIDGGVQCALL